MYLNMQHFCLEIVKVRLPILMVVLYVLAFIDERSGGKEGVFEGSVTVVTVKKIIS